MSHMPRPARRTPMPSIPHSESVGVGTGGTDDGPMKRPKARGLVPTVTVATTVLVAVSRTETLLEPAFATYTRVPAGSTAAPVGAGPTGTVATTVLVAVSRTETLLVPWFAT